MPRFNLDDIDEFVVGDECDEHARPHDENKLAGLPKECLVVELNYWKLTVRLS
jgi:hypothetical protein